MNREEALDVALGQIERQFGKGSVMRMSDQAQVCLRARGNSGPPGLRTPFIAYSSS